MSVGVCIGADDIHLPRPGHDFHTDLREFLQNIQDGRRSLGTFQGGMTQHPVGGKIIEKGSIAGNGGQRQLDIPQCGTDGFRRTAGCHRKASAHLDEQPNDGAVAFGNALFCRQQGVVHIAKNQIVVQVPFHLRCSFLRRVR